MPSSDVRDRIRRLALAQGGVVQRTQLLDAGVASATIGRLTGAGRWQTLLPGVYAVHDQPVDDLARVWGAVLYAARAGALAVASGATALWLAGVIDGCPEVVEVTTSADRRVRRQPGLRVRVSERVDVHPVLQPPRERLETALLNAVASARGPERVVDLVLRAGQRRLTTPARLSAAARDRRRLRWRALVQDLCADLVAGVQSPLEQRYARRVERAHRLPRAERNRAEPVDGARWYRDVRYRRWRVVVELDGRGAHPPDEAFRDRRRDNRAARAGEVALRYGWREVVAAPCEVAGEVAQVLRGRGWGGRLRPCGPSCAAVPPQGEDFFPLGGKKSSA